MKKTQLKDAIRNIWKQKVSFLSIVIIAMIGATTFLGIDFSANAMRINGSELYNKYNFRDIEVISTLMFTQEDLEALRGIEGVTDAEPIRLTDAKIPKGDMREDIQAITVTERINVAELIEGRMPQEVSECAIEEFASQNLGLRIGDRITLYDAEGKKKAEHLKVNEFVIVGVVKHPDHVNSIVPNVPYAVVKWEAFDDEELDGCFMRAELVIDKPDGINRFSAKYNKLVNAVMERIDEIAVERAEKRDEFVRGGWNAELDENEKKLDDAEKQLEDARREITEKTSELIDGIIELHDAEVKLDFGKTALDDARVKIEAGKKELDAAKKTLDTERVKLVDGKKELDAAKAKLDSAKKELEDGFDAIEEGKAKIRDIFKEAYKLAFKDGEGYSLIRWAEVEKANADDPAETARYLWLTDSLRVDLGRAIEDVAGAIVNSESISDKLLVALYKVSMLSEPPRTGDGEYDMDAVRATLVSNASAMLKDYNLLADACAQWDKGHDEYVAGLVQYRDGLAKYEDGKAQFDAGEAKYNDGVKEYQAGLEEYLAQKAKYEKGVAEAANGQAQIDDGQKKLDDGEKQIEDGQVELDNGREQYYKAREKVDSIPPCRWISFAGNGNASFSQLRMGSESISSIKMTFSLLFIIVGALVIFATVGKMVDEHRKLIGTTKALGFFNKEIFAKYLIFGVSPTVLGIILGVAAARLGVEPFLLNGLNKYYFFDISKPRFMLLPTVLVIAAAAVMAAVAVWFACTKLLREPAVRLMQDKMPAGRKGQGGRRGLSLYSRLILLNMRSDLKRVIVTIVSVAGCCALIVVGLTLRSAMKGCVDKQYGGVTDYDIVVKYEPDYLEERREKFCEILIDEGVDFTDVYRADVTYNAEDMQMGELICGSIDPINNFMHLNDWRSGKPLFATNEGVLIQRRTAEMFGLDVGSEFDLTLGARTVFVRVGGVFENYIGRTIVMSKDYYWSLFFDYCPSNAFLVDLNGADEAQLTEKLHNVEGFDTVTRADADRTIVETSTSMADAVVALFIFIAAVLAGVVLMNLTNMYILHKKRELTVMRINGFSVKEAKGYVLRETFVTTALGVILGVLAGAGIGYAIIRTLEQNFLQFDRSVNFLAWGAAAVITVIFTVVVNMIALRKIKHLKLTDVN